MPTVCSSEFPVDHEPEALRPVLSLGADGIDDDGVARFGFVAGILGVSAPISEDVDFDISSQLERRFAAATSHLAVPAPGSAVGVLPGSAYLGQRRRRSHRSGTA